MIPGYVIAGTNSGAGKTTVTLGILAWLKRHGFRTAPFKVGPDFIDPGHHTRITGTPSRNLDGWMLSREYNRQTFRDYTKAADIALVEGVMGLYDGYDGKSEAGSTAQMAKWLGLPVILVVNAKSMARSAAALVMGFLEFDPALPFAGVVFNNLGSSNHLRYLEEAMHQYLSVPVLGGLLRDPGLSMPERHLGLVTDADHPLTPARINHLANWIDTGLNMKKLTAGIQPQNSREKSVPAQRPSKNPLRIGVARDEAFCFYYPDNLEILERFGARIVFFSPLHDRSLPDNLSGLYLGGGYPELHVDQLAANKAMCRQIRAAGEQGMPIYGECGGLMYLGEAFVEKNGTVHPLTGCLPIHTRLLDRLKSLGYRDVRLRTDTVIGPEGTRARGHEFHYSEILNREQTAGFVDLKTAYDLAVRSGKQQRPEGFCRGRILGSYVHLHFGSNPEIGRHFTAACGQYRQSQMEQTA